MIYYNNIQLTARDMDVSINRYKAGRRQGEAWWSPTNGKAYGRGYEARDWLRCVCGVGQLPGWLRSNLAASASN